MRPHAPPYRLVKTGRTNKRNKEVFDIELDETAAEITGSFFTNMCMRATEHSGYDRCSFETKKMFVSKFIKSVRVFRDYRLEIDFNVSYEEFRNLTVQTAG